MIASFLGGAICCQDFSRLNSVGVGAVVRGPRVASEGNRLAPFLSHHQHLSRKARWAILQNSVGVPDPENPPLAPRLSPLASRLSPLASRLSPLASRLSPLAPRPSPLAPRHSGFVIYPASSTARCAASRSITPFLPNSSIAMNCSWLKVLSSPAPCTSTNCPSSVMTTFKSTAASLSST